MRVTSSFLTAAAAVGFGRSDWAATAKRKPVRIASTMTSTVRVDVARGSPAATRRSAASW